MRLLFSKPKPKIPAEPALVLQDSQTEVIVPEPGSFVAPDHSELNHIKETIIGMLEESEDPELKKTLKHSHEHTEPVTSKSNIDDMNFEITVTGLEGHEMIDEPELDQKPFAELVRQWAKIFKAGKVDKEYKAAHPGVVFEPYSFALAELKAAEARIAADTIQEIIGNAPLHAVLHGLDDESVERLADAIERTGNGVLQQTLHDYTLDSVARAAYGPVQTDESSGDFLINPRKYKETQEALQDSGSTLGALWKLYTDALKAMYVVPLISQASMIESVLQDVREGRSARVSRKKPVR